MGEDPSPEKIREIMKKYYDIDLTEEQVKVIQENPLKKLDPRHFYYGRNGSHSFCIKALPQDRMGNRFPLRPASFPLGDWSWFRQD